MHRESSPPADESLSAREVFLKLRGTRSSGYELPTNLASYGTGSIPIPDADHPVSLVNLLDGDDRENVALFEQRCVLPECDLARKIEDDGPIKPYVHPVLFHDWRKSTKVIRDATTRALGWKSHEHLIQTAHYRICTLNHSSLLGMPLLQTSRD